MAESVQSRIELRVTGAAEIDKAVVSLDRLAVAHDGVAVASDRSTKVRERIEAKLERQARAMDAEYRLLRRTAEAQKILDQARGDGLSNLTAFNRLQTALTKGTNANARATGLARHEWINLSRQFQDVGVSLAGGQSPLLVMLQQGSQIADIFSSSGAGAGAALRSFGAGALRALTSPAGAAASLAAAIAGIGYEASKAQQQLAELGRQSRMTGLSAETLQGAKVIGAGVGLDVKQSVGAFSTAGRQFEAYSRNSGSVLSALQQVDKSFIGVVDRARSAGEFVDLLNTKIAQLPTRQAEQLAAALYGDEAAKRLLDSIRAGEVSMRALREASGATGQSLGQSATAADEMRNRIERAAAEADNKLLVAFRNIKSPTDDIKIGWYGVVGAIADAVTQSEKLQRTMSAMTSWSALFKEIGRGYDAVDKMLGARPVSRLEDDRPRQARPGEIQFPTFAEAKAAFLPKLTTPTVGESRHLFEKEKAPRHGKSAEERSLEKYQKISKELENQLSLLRTQGAAHDRLALAIKIQNEQLKIGKGITQAQRDNVAAMVTKIDEAEKAQQRLNKATNAFNEAYGSVSNTLAGSIKDLIHGEKPRDVLKKMQTSMQDNLLDSMLTGNGPFAKILGTAGANGAVGGIFGSIAKGFGIDGKTFAEANIRASVVNIEGGSGGDSSNKESGIFGSMLKNVGNLFGSGAKSPGYFSSPLFSGSPFTFGFANGGVMTSMGPLPLRRYDKGGIANTPQLSLFGEGSRPEAYVPLPDGRSIPVTMDAAPAAQPAPAGPRITINQNAPGVQVTPRVASDGEIMLAVAQIVDARIDQNNRSLPGILSEMQRNAN